DAAPVRAVRSAAGGAGVGRIFNVRTHASDTRSAETWIDLHSVRPVRKGITVATSNSFKFVMLPPQTDTTRRWAKRLAEAVPEVRVVVAEDAATAAREIVDAEAA